MNAPAVVVRGARVLVDIERSDGTRLRLVRERVLSRNGVLFTQNVLRVVAADGYIVHEIALGLLEVRAVAEGLARLDGAV